MCLKVKTGGEIVIRNIIVSIVSLPVLFYATILSVEPCTALINMLFKPDSGISIYFVGLFILFDFYIIGLLLIKSTGNKAKDFFSIGLLGLLVYIYTVVVDKIMPNPFDSPFQSFIRTEDIKYLGEAIALKGVFLVGSFLPSVFLWLGMFSRKKNRIKIKNTTLNRINRHKAIEEAGSDTNTLSNSQTD